MIGLLGPCSSELIDHVGLIESCANAITSPRHRYPPGRRSELLLGIAQKSSLGRPRLSGFPGMQRRDIGGGSFNRQIGAEPFDAIPQQMKVIELSRQICSSSCTVALRSAVLIACAF